MPWDDSDASSKTRKANTPAKRRQWSDIANKVREESHDEGKAVRIANAAVKNHPSLKGKK